jgi:hypothetical protein
MTGPLRSGAIGFRGASFAAVLLAALAGTIGSARAGCESPGFNPGGTFCNGCRYEGSIRVGHDQACERTYNMRGSFQQVMEFIGNRVVQRARHGVAGANANTFAYMPAKGFSGRDDFTVEVAYRKGTETGKFQVHFTVEVE